MTWTAALIGIPLACYLGASVAYWMQGNIPLAVVYFGYAFANCGLLALDLQK